MKKATKKNLLTKVLYAWSLVLLMGSAAIAQGLPAQEQPQVKTDFSENELEKFVDVYVQVAEIQQENETVMMQAIEEENLDINRFNEILQAQQQQATGQAQPADSASFTAEEMAAFNNAAQKIMAVQQEAQTEMQQVIDKEVGLETYEQIVLAYQQSPEVQQQINKLLEEKMPATETQEQE